MVFRIFTLFPEMFKGPFEESMIKSARENRLVDIVVADIRDFATDKHRTADDYPFGGGPGMIMKPEPVFLAVESALQGRDKNSLPVVLLSPQGRRFDHGVALDLSRRQEIMLICGHYKGVDERIRAHLANDEISIGDFVMSGGELAAMVIVDAVARLLPGVLGDFESAETDTFYDGLLAPAAYTKPRDFRGLTVPEVLLGGNHEEIRLWRRRDSLKRTLARRPDLIRSAHLSDEDRQILAGLRKPGEATTE